MEPVQAIKNPSEIHFFSVVEIHCNNICGLTYFLAFAFQESVVLGQKLRTSLTALSKSESVCSKTVAKQRQLISILPFINGYFS